MNNDQHQTISTKDLICKFIPEVGKVYLLEIDQPITRFKELAQSFATAIVAREFAGGCDFATRVLRAFKSASMASHDRLVVKGKVGVVEPTSVEAGRFTVKVWIEDGDALSEADVLVEFIDSSDVIACVESYPPRRPVSVQSVRAS